MSGRPREGGGRAPGDARREAEPEPAPFTALEDPAAEERVRRDLRTAVDVLVERLAPRAILLGGSYGRGEGAMVRTKDGWRPRNDFDLWLVREEPVPPARLAALEEELASLLDLPHVDLASLASRELRGLGPAQSTYDLVRGGRLVYGDRGVLSDLPPADADQIPAASALGLLFNRTAGLLGSFRVADFAGPEDRGSRPTDEEAVQVEHALTACGDAALILAGRYHHLAREKARRAPSVLEAVPGLEAGQVSAVVAAYRTRLTAVESGGSGPPARVGRTRSTLLAVLLWALDRTVGARAGAGSEDPFVTRLEAYLAGRRDPLPRRILASLLAGWRRRSGAEARARWADRTGRIQAALAAVLWAAPPERREKALAAARRYLEGAGGPPPAAGPDPEGSYAEAWDELRRRAFEAWDRYLH